MEERQHGGGRLQRVRHHHVGIFQEIVVVPQGGSAGEDGYDQQRDQDLHPVERECPAKHGAYRSDGLSVEETRAVGERDGYAHGRGGAAVVAAANDAAPTQGRSRWLQDSAPTETSVSPAPDRTEVEAPAVKV